MRSGIRVSLIAAVAENGVIGRDNAIPWRLSADHRRFRKLTMGRPVIMGRKTFESIGKPLPGRTNIVVSGQSGFCREGITVAPDIDAALAIAKQQAAGDGVDEIFVIGGEEIYRAVMPRADRLCITHVAAAPQGDTYLPPIDPAVWRGVLRESVAAGDRDSAATTFVVYDRLEAIRSG